MAKLTTKAPPLRNLIAMNDELEVKYWTKHLGVSREELQRAVDKVGNSAPPVGIPNFIDGSLEFLSAHAKMFSPVFHL